ncbi:MAG: hypothetical protein AB7E85_00825 [Pseudobdellovibrionaceae bacterium]
MQHYSTQSFLNGASGLTETPSDVRMTIRRHEPMWNKTNKRRLGIGFGMAAALSLATAAMLPSSNETAQGADISAASRESSSFDGATTCSADNPILFEGRHNRFVISNPDTCATLMHAMPAPNETVQFDDRISIRAYTQGGVKVTMQVGDDQFVQDVPREIYRALLEGWLTTMDDNQRPLSFGAALYMYKQESALGASLRVAPEDGTACGMGMTTIANFAANLMETGDRVGLGTMRWNALKIEAGMNLRARGRPVTEESEMAEIGRIKDTGYVNYPRLVRNPHFREIFGTRCDDVTPGAILGAQNLAIQSAYLQDQVDRGRLQLPDGRTQITLRDAYLRYMLQGNMDRLYRALHTNPNVRLDVLFAADGVYDRNPLFHGRGRALTARELYDHIPERGFDDHYTIHMRNYEPMSHDIGDQFDAAADTPNGRLLASPNYDYVFVTQPSMQKGTTETETASAAVAAPAVS